MLHIEYFGRWSSRGFVAAAVAAIGCSGGSGTGGSGAAAGSGASAGSGAFAGTGALGGSGASAGSGGAAGAATGGSAGSSGSGASAGTGATGGSGGVEICGNGIEDNGNGYKDCDDEQCFKDAACIAADLSNQKMAGFTVCGKPLSFTSTDSDQACQDYAVSSFPTFTSKCQYATYSGTITFYCAPSKDAVGIRWEVQTQVPIEMLSGKPVLWENLGGEYQFLNHGGSSAGPLHSVSSVVGNAALHEHFVGYDQVAVKADTKGDYHHWFALWTFSGAAPQVAGGFVATIDAVALFGGG
jgi:hypothetical protein